MKAFNQSDAPIAGARVQFSAPSGTFDQPVKFSDAEGLVKVTYTLGSSPGPVAITASTLAGEVVVQFSATVDWAHPPASGSSAGTRRPEPQARPSRRRYASG